MKKEIKNNLKLLSVGMFMMMSTHVSGSAYDESHGDFPADNNLSTTIAPGSTRVEPVIVEPVIAVLVTSEQTPPETLTALDDLPTANVTNDEYCDRVVNFLNIVDLTHADEVILYVLNIKADYSYTKNLNETQKTQLNRLLFNKLNTLSHNYEDHDCFEYLKNLTVNRQNILPYYRYVTGNNIENSNEQSQFIMNSLNNSDLIDNWKRWIVCKYIALRSQTTGQLKKNHKKAKKEVIEQVNKKLHIFGSY